MRAVTAASCQKGCWTIQRNELPAAETRFAHDTVARRTGKTRAKSR